MKESRKQATNYNTNLHKYSNTDPLKHTHTKPKG